MITIHHQQFKYTHNTFGHYLTGVYLFSIGPTLSTTDPGEWQAQSDVKPFSQVQLTKET